MSKITLPFAIFYVQGYNYLILHLSMMLLITLSSSPTALTDSLHYLKDAMPNIFMMRPHTATANSLSVCTSGGSYRRPTASYSTISPICPRRCEESSTNGFHWVVVAGTLISLHCRWKYLPRLHPELYMEGISICCKCKLVYVHFFYICNFLDKKEAKK